MKVNKEKLLKKTFIAIGLLQLSSLVCAGAMGDVEPAQTWTGFYAGLNAGAIWSDADFTWTNIAEGGVAFAAGAATVLPAAANADLKDSGFTGGFQLGWNYQVSDSFLVGIEADYNFSDLEDERNVVSLGNTNGGPATIVPSVIHESFSTGWFGTIRARAGIIQNDWLFYGTGGAIFANTGYVDQVCFPTSALPTCNRAFSKESQEGWTVGGGVEWRFADNLSAKAEYLYADLGNHDYVSAPRMIATNFSVFPQATITHNHDTTDNILRVGVNYKFA